MEMDISIYDINMCQFCLKRGFSSDCIKCGWFKNQIDLDANDKFDINLSNGMYKEELLNEVVR